MNSIHFPNDIKVVFITASSFPEGVLEAHQKLHSIVPYSTERKYFGISHPVESGEIIYKAAAEVNEVELEQFNNLEVFTIAKGNFAEKTILNYIENLPSIGEAFEQLIQLPNIKPNGYCLEWYITEKEVKCLVPLI